MTSPVTKHERQIQFQCISFWHRGRQKAIRSATQHEAKFCGRKNTQNTERQTSSERLDHKKYSNDASPVSCLSCLLPYRKGTCITYHRGWRNVNNVGFFRSTRGLHVNVGNNQHTGRLNDGVGHPKPVDDIGVFGINLPRREHHGKQYEHFIELHDGNLICCCCRFLVCFVSLGWQRVFMFHEAR